MQKLPADARQIRARFYRPHKLLWPQFSFAVWQALKNTIFKSGQHLRYTKPFLVFVMLAAFDCAADGTAFAVFPIFAFDKFIRFRMSVEL